MPRSTAEDRFRLCCPDYLSRLFAPPLAERLAGAAPCATLEIAPWHEGAVDDVARGRIDALLRPNRLTPLLRSEEILRNDMVCVMSASHPLAGRRMTMKGYLAYPHIMVTVMSGERTMVDEQLVAAGHRRRIGLRVPYFGSAVLAVENTHLIATVPRIAAQQYTRGTRVCILPSPFKFEPIRILMSWHTSTDAEPSLRWFRNQVGDIARQLA